jgi:hypothetical protein
MKLRAMRGDPAMKSGQSSQGQRLQSAGLESGNHARGSASKEICPRTRSLLDAESGPAGDVRYRLQESSIAEYLPGRKVCGDAVGLAPDFECAVPPDQDRTRHLHQLLTTVGGSRFPRETETKAPKVQRFYDLKQRRRITAYRVARDIPGSRSESGCGPAPPPIWRSATDGTPIATDGTPIGHGCPPGAGCTCFLFAAPAPRKTRSHNI